MQQRSGWLAACSAAIAGLTVSPSLWAAPTSGELAICGAPRYAQEALFLRQQRLLHEPELAQTSTAPVDPSGKESAFSSLRAGPIRRSQAVPARPTAVGDIAIIEGTPEILTPPNHFDLSGGRIQITPGPNGFQVLTEVSSTLPPIDGRGVVLDLGDDTATRVELPFEFLYYGKTYPGAFVHSDGNLTFSVPEASSNHRTYSRAAGGPPRIAPLFEDLDPSVAGQIRYAATPDRVYVTWDQVPLWAETGVGQLQTFQLVLGADGSIEFRYGDVDLPAAVVGIFAGDVNQPTVAIDWSETPTSVFDGSGTLAEVFTSKTTIDEFAAFHAFFRTQDDAYDSVIVFNDLDLRASEHTLAHAYTVRNEVIGIGKVRFDSGPYFGSPRRVGAFVNMGSMSGYPDDPLGPIPFRRDSTMLTVLAHEIGHRFLASVFFIDPETGKFNPTLLGRQLDHWSFFFNSRASVLEGNAIRDHGSATSPRFETFAASQTYSDLDRYLMGFLDAGEVTPSFLVEDPVGAGDRDRKSPPQVGVKFDGVRKDVRIEDIVAAHGGRRPDTSVSQRHFRFAFVLVVDEGGTPDPETLRLLNRLRNLWRAFFIAHLEGRATASIDLVQMLHVSTWPAGGVIDDATGRARIEIARARETDLSVSLSLSEAIASVPATVTIPAGELYVDFDVSGLEPGATSLIAEASEPGYDRAVTRLAVRENLQGLGLQRLHPPALYGLASSELRFPLEYVLRDENLVPYSGIEMEFLAAADGSPVIATPVTDAFGQISVNWRLGMTAQREQFVARLKDAPEVAISTTVTTMSGTPAFDGAAVVNAASQEPARPGAGFAPGSLLTILGSALALEALPADPPPESDVPFLPYRLGVTRVHVDGVGAPLVQVSPTQVTFQLAFEAQSPSVNVVVATPYGRSDSVAIPVSAVQPGIFPDRVSGVSSDPEANASVVPHASGVLKIYCTGLGAVSPPGKTGSPNLLRMFQRTVAETTAWIDNRKVNVTYSGLALSQAGVYRVILDLPADLQPGEHEIKIAVGGVESNAVLFQSE